MLFDNEDHKSNVSRHAASKRMIRASSGLLLSCAGGLQSMTQVSSARAATAAAQVKMKDPIMVNDRTSFFWRTVSVGARKIALLRCASDMSVLDERRS